MKKSLIKKSLAFILSLSVFASLFFSVFSFSNHLSFYSFASANVLESISTESVQYAQTESGTLLKRIVLPGSVFLDFVIQKYEGGAFALAIDDMTLNTEMNLSFFDIDALWKFFDVHVSKTLEYGMLSFLCVFVLLIKSRESLFIRSLFLAKARAQMYDRKLILGRFLE